MKNIFKRGARTRVMYYFYLVTVLLHKGGRDGSVGIAIRYRLDGPGFESPCGRDFPYTFTPVPKPTQPPVQWGPGLFLGGESGRGVALTTHPLLAPSWYVIG